MNSSLLNLARAESPSSEETVTPNIIAPSSTFNQVGGHQYNINVHPAPTTPLPTGSASNAPPPVQSPFNDAPIDNLSIHFTGRKRELALIDKAFEKRGEIPLRCALHGNQGVGKSQLTYSWAKSTFTRKENAFIMWVSATTVEKLCQGFSRLLRLVNHPDKSHQDQEARLEAARRWLEEVDSGNWLLIFDNVCPETVDFLRQHLPRVNGRGTILFTARTRDVAIAVTSAAGEQHEVIEVPLLDVKEGVELFCAHFAAGQVDQLSSKVEAIVKAVGCLPLAISHAAAYMDQTRSSLDNMLELYQSKHKIDAMSWENTLSNYEHKSVAATFVSQLQDLDRKCPDAIKLLRIIAFLDPESISLEMLITGAEAVTEVQRRQTQSPFKSSLLSLIQSPRARQKAIDQLQSSCLLAYHNTSTSPTFCVHDLIQLVVLENMSSTLSERSFELAVELVCAAFQKIGNPESPKSWAQCESLIPHIHSLTLRQDTSSKAKKALILVTHERARYLCSRGRFAEAENLYDKIIVNRKQVFGRDDPKILAVEDHLAWVYRRQGRYADAEVLFQKVLEGYKTRRGPEHRCTLKTKYHLAEVYLDQNRYDDAEKLLIQILRFGSGGKTTLKVMNVLGDVYRLQLRYEEAESWFTQLLNVRTKLLGSENRYTFDTKHNLANVYMSQGQYDAAAALFQEVLRVSERDLGPQHPDTLATMSALARVYTSRECNEEAEKLLVRVLAGRENVYGLAHPHTKRTAKKLLLVYNKLGQVDEARMLERRFSSTSG